MELIENFEWYDENMCWWMNHDYVDRMKVVWHWWIVRRYPWIIDRDRWSNARWIGRNSRNYSAFQQQQQRLIVVYGQSFDVFELKEERCIIFLLMQKNKSNKPLKHWIRLKKPFCTSDLWQCACWLAVNIGDFSRVREQEQQDDRKEFVGCLWLIMVGDDERMHVIERKKSLCFAFDVMVKIKL